MSLTRSYTWYRDLYGYVPRYVYGDEPFFVSCELLADTAERLIKEYAEFQFREKAYYLGLSPLDRNRSEIYINTAKMMAIWRKCRLDPSCPGVNFTLGYNKKIVAYDAV